MAKVVIENIVKEMEGTPSPFFPESQTIRFEFRSVKLSCNVSEEGLQIMKTSNSSNPILIEGVSSNVILIK